MSNLGDPPPFNLHEAFLAKQKELAASLHTGAVVASHGTTKGDDTELNWVSMLASLLPSRYGVAKAHVIDSNGRQSDQLDVVIHDRFFSPLLFDVGGAKFIPAESVYAVFEVKQHLDREHMTYTAEKIASVRGLHRTSLPIPSAMGELQKKDLTRFPNSWGNSDATKRVESSFRRRLPQVPGGVPGSRCYRHWVRARSRWLRSHSRLQERVVAPRGCASERLRHIAHLLRYAAPASPSAVGNRSRN